jgi:hypothetical protein
MEDKLNLYLALGLPATDNEPLESSLVWRYIIHVTMTSILNIVYKRTIRNMETVYIFYVALSTDNSIQNPCGSSMYSGKDNTISIFFEN